MKRKDVAAEYGVESIAFVPFEGGVLEFGTSQGAATADWAAMPEVPTMPKEIMRKAFENLGASYALYWAREGDEFVPRADFTTASRKTSPATVRGDDKTFSSESMGYRLDANGDGPVATAARSGKEVYIADTSTMKRAGLAKEFGIKRVHFVPFDGGVLEYGTPAGAFLSGPLMEASLKMRCDTSGAGYSIYWKEVDGQLTIAGSYVTPERAAALKASGKEMSFAEASADVTLDAKGIGPVATVIKTREPVFVKEVATSTMKRKELALEYGVRSVCFVPVEGGVMEYGVSAGAETADWATMSDARTAIMPKAEMKKAFENGATHLIFWKPEGDKYVAGASFVLPERLRALKAARGDDKSYTSESLSFELDVAGEGPVATAARSGKEIVVADAKNEPTYKRAALAEEFGVGDVHFVPCRDGVLEYGRGSGSE